MWYKSEETKLFWIYNGNELSISKLSHSDGLFMQHLTKYVKGNELRV